MSIGPINAMPTKKLFIDTLVRDVSLEDAILDLVDNAIDGYIRNAFTDMKKIRINQSATHFEIYDNCGGISIKHAQEEVFRFGVTDERNKDTLGVYGIGLKRSLFKMGRMITFESDNLENYFRIHINLNEWEKTEDWNFEFDEVSESSGEAYTKISIKSLNEETKFELGKDSFNNKLYYRLSRTYFLFLKDKVDIYLNEKFIEPYELKIGFSNQINPSVRIFEVDGVKVKLTAGAHPDYMDPGWYIFCNKRLIIIGDTSVLTGWGDRGVPNYHNKYNRFKGFAYIDSSDPSKLPWNTAKNGIDKGSPIYNKMLNEMQTMTQQFTSYMSKAYPTEKEETIGKDILGDFETASVVDFNKDQSFKAPPIPTTPRYTTIRYKKLRKDVEHLKNCMGNKWMSNAQLGERTFDYYKEMECDNEE